MKKVIAKTLAFLAVFGMISGSAMAADPIEVYKDDVLVEQVKLETLHRQVMQSQNLKQHLKGFWANRRK